MSALSSDFEGLPGTAGVDRKHRPSDFFHERTNFKFIQHTRTYIIMFLVVVLGGLALLALKPLNLGIDFRGGVSWQVNIAKGTPASAAEIRKIIDKIGITDYKATISTGNRRTIRVQAQLVDDPIKAIRSAIAKATGKVTNDVSNTQVGVKNTFTVTKVSNPNKAAVVAALTPKVLGTAKATVTVNKTDVTVNLDQAPKSVRERVSKDLATYAHANANDVSISTVGPTWGNEVSKKALIALLVFFFVLAVYLSLRFEFKMAVAAIVAVVHDIIFTVAVYSLTQFTVSPATVTAFLTILGFSLYDTVVVFDKIKENERSLTTVRSTYSDMANRSLNEVLMRSLSTSFVALMPVISLLVIGSGIMGATALEDFALALLAGLFVGTYSSVFVAAPLLVLWKERDPKYRAMRERKEARDKVNTKTTVKLSVIDSQTGDNVDWDTTGVAGPPAVMRAPVAPKPRQQRGNKRK